MPKFEIDGVTFETGSPEFVQALSLRDKRIDGEIAQLRAERDKATAERDASAKALTEANDPKRIDSRVAARVALADRARRVLGADAKIEGKTDREIMIETIRHDDTAFAAEGRSDEYVAAYFEASTKSLARHDEGGTGIGAARSAAVAAVREDKADRTDGKPNEDPNDAEAARIRMLTNNREAAAKPLRFSREA